MKTLIKSLALALSLGLVASATSFTEAKPITRPSTVAAYQAGIYTAKDNKLHVALDKEQGGVVDVRFKNSDGQVLYSYHLGKNQTTYRTRLSLGELPDGVYEVEITNGVETTKHTVTIATQQPSAPGRVVALN